MMSGLQSARRVLAGSAAVLMLAATIGVVSATPVGAAADQKVTGSVTGSAPFTFAVGGCSFVHQNYLGTITTAKGRTASINVDVCVDFGRGDFVASGTFAITTDKAQVTGTATGTVGAAVNPTPFSFDLVVIDRSHGLARRGSTFHLSGAWTSDTASGGPITGTIIG